MKKILSKIRKWILLNEIKAANGITFGGYNGDAIITWVNTQKFRFHLNDWRHEMAKEFRLNGTIKQRGRFKVWRDREGKVTETAEIYQP